MIETKNFGYYVYRVIGYLILAFIVVVSVFPILWVIMSSFKSNGAILGSPFSLPDTFNFNAYREVFEQHNVFSAAMIDGIIKRLRSYGDSTLREEIGDDQEAMLALVQRYFHCG